MHCGFSIPPVEDDQTGSSCRSYRFCRSVLAAICTAYSGQSSLATGASTKSVSARNSARSAKACLLLHRVHCVLKRRLLYLGHSCPRPRQKLFSSRKSLSAQYPSLRQRRLAMRRTRMSILQTIRPEPLPSAVCWNVYSSGSSFQKHLIDIQQHVADNCHRGCVDWIHTIRKRAERICCKFHRVV